MFCVVKNSSILDNIITAVVKAINCRIVSLSLKIGDTIEMKGPKGHMEYLRGGSFTVKPLGKPNESRQTNQIIMMAGGTGITPMLQMLHFIFKNPGDPSIRVNLLYANQSEYNMMLYSTVV